MRAPILVLFLLIAGLAAACSSSALPGSGGTGGSPPTGGSPGTGGSATGGTGGAAVSECTQASDCVLHDDCCACAAVPKASSITGCTAECFADVCATHGITAANVDCFMGRCVLQVSSCDACTGAGLICVTDEVLGGPNHRCLTVPAACSTNPTCACVGACTGPFQCADPSSTTPYCQCPTC